VTCPVCGTVAVPGARFCHACGAALPTAVVVAATTERRVVTVLFGDLSDFTAWAEDLDPERVGRLTDRVLATLANAVTAFGGAVDKLTGDGIMAVFGAPVTHEDDPERAVRAAMAMQRAVRKVVAEQEDVGGRRLGLRVGVNTGHVVAGVQAGMSYTVVGDTVNTAARLADAAHVRGVYVGARTARATRDRAAYRRLAPLRLKGKRQPVEAYELLGLRDAPGARPGLGDEAPFVGREAELGRITGRFAEITDRAEPHVLVVTADAGMGKTRLAAEVARVVAAEPEARVLSVRCRSWAGTERLQPLVDVVRLACGLDGDEPFEGERGDGGSGDRVDDRGDGPDSAGRIAKVLERVTASERGADALADAVSGTLIAATADPVAKTGAVLADLIGVPTPGPAGRASHGADSELNDPSPAAVAALISALAADGPVLLVVDDVHHAGPSTVAALSETVNRLNGGVLALLLGRPELVRSGPLVGLADAESLPLTPLSGAAASRLLRSYLGGGRLPDKDVDRLLATAQGNPFWLAELVSLLVEQGRLTGGSAGWRLTPETLSGELLSVDLAAVLAARIDTLPATARAVLRDAAVVGDRVPPGALEVLRGQHGRPVRSRIGSEELRRALAELVSRRMLRRRSGGGYAFVTTLLREAAYAGVGKADLADRHWLLARWGAEHSARGVSGAVDGLRAPEWDAFVAGHAERAVALADDMHLPPSAGARRATALGVAALSGEPLPAGARLLQARALLQTGRLADALKVAEELATAPADAPQGAVHRAAALLVAGDAHRAGGNLDGASASWHEALALARGLAGAGVTTEARAAESGRSAEVPTAARLLAGAPDPERDRLETEALRRLGMLDHLTGRLLHAEQRFTEAYERAVRAGDAPGQGWALQHLAWAATSRGDLAGAEDALGRASALFDAYADVPGRSWVRGTEAFVRMIEGRLSEAREAAQTFLPFGERAGDTWAVAVLRAVAAFAAAEVGELAHADDEARRALVALDVTGDDWARSLALVVRGVVARGLAQPGRAIDLLNEADRVGERSSNPLTAAMARTIRGFSRLDGGDGAGAEADARETLAGLASLELDDAAKVGPLVLLAEARRAQGDLAGALPLLAGVVENSGSGPALVFPRRQALAHYATALVEVGRVAEAAAWARKAQDVPAEDVRSRVVALRALATALAASGESAAALEAAERAVHASTATEQVSERAACDALFRSLSTA
jgi:class 3 adenylate cyclase/tetratricopeptide (TPR) repeat protein